MGTRFLLPTSELLIYHPQLHLNTYLHPMDIQIFVTILNILNVHPMQHYRINLDHMDIYSPCALGATVNDDTLERLKCSIIAGAANNQLANEEIHGEALRERGIIYAPDYLINAGGVMNCYGEVSGLPREEVMKMAENIYETTLDIFKSSREQGIPTYLAANRKAEKRIAELTAKQ